MAFLVTDEFYEVRFLKNNDAAWVALGFVNAPGIPQAMSYKIANGDTIPLYVIDAAAGLIAIEGGQGSIFDDTLIDVASAALTKYTLTSNGGYVTKWANDAAGSGISYYYDGISGTLQIYSAVQAGGLKAHLI